MAESPLILLVDDDPDFLEIVRLLLTARGFRVTCCSDPRQAWDRLVAEPPALVVTDLMMTNLDSGFSLSRQIKEHPSYRNIPVIIATAASSQMGLDFRPRSAEELAALHVDAYFDKPLSPKHFLDTVAELLTRGAGAAPCNTPPETRAS